jgi:hypothetical protein
MLKNRFIPNIFRIVTGLMLWCGMAAFAADSAATNSVSAGFLYDKFRLTLADGERTEAAGPFFYSEINTKDQTLAFPPFYSDYKQPGVDAGEYDILYPLLTCIHYSDERRWQFAQVLSFAGGRQPDENLTRRFTLFPFYFQQRSVETNLNYTAVVPFYGHLQNRLFRDRIFFVMFPFYSRTQRKDIVTDNYLYPFVDVRRGTGLRGWQVWPIVGQEHKVVTLQTNGFGDVTTNPGHDQSFLFWPLWLRQNNGIGTEDPETFRASIPLFVKERSPLRDQTSVLWPIFTWVDERGRKYHEWEGPWPLVIFARGEGKTTSRVWPIFSESHDATKESDSYVWPLYRYKRLHSDPLDQQRRSVLFYAYVNVLERNTETGKHQQRVAMWPFFTWHRDFNGNRQLQVFAPFEVVLPTNRGLLRNWSPLWSVWRAEANPRAGTGSQSFLWNLYRREEAPGHKKVSLLFGLFQYQRDGENHRTRLFYLTVSRTPESGR